MPEYLTGAAPGRWRRRNLGKTWAKPGVPIATESVSRSVTEGQKSGVPRKQSVSLNRPRARVRRGE